MVLRKQPACDPGQSMCLSFFDNLSWQLRHVTGTVARMAVSCRRGPAVGIWVPGCLIDNCALLLLAQNSIGAGHASLCSALQNTLCAYRTCSSHFFGYAAALAAVMALACSMWCCHGVCCEFAEPSGPDILSSCCWLCPRQQALISLVQCHC